ncbi:MAG TPA: translocation/assembly module TamB domain-containing protein, partial [Candidatus Eremiobacteraceae bacterium]|nr:translocation/assembly module TamB domain-containing protein [Candidatus Eremiobacteraceae bacterium]
HAWLGDVKVSDVHARVAKKSEEVSADGVAALIGGQVHIYGATARLAGGEVAVAGTLPSARAGDLDAYASHVDGAALAALGAPISSGTITAFAHLTGPLSAPHVALDGALTNGIVAGRAISGDGDFALAGGNLTIADARVSLDDTRGYLTGDVRGIGRVTNDASLHMRAAMPNVDLGSVATSVAGDNAPISGLGAADVLIGGTLGAPTMRGALSADIGALRGVPFDNLQADVSGSPSALDIQNGGVRFGSTRLAVAGSVAPSSVALHIESPHVQLDDFNDFFNGKDVLEGHGSLAVSVESAGDHVRASGGAQMRDVAIDGIPAGLVDVSLSNAGAATLATIGQRNALGSITAQAGVQSAAVSRALTAGFGAAQYSLDARISRLDLAALAPYVGAEDQGLTGMVNGTIHAAGPLRAPTGAAQFAVSHGTLRGVAFDDVSTRLASDGRSVQLRSLRADAQQTTVTASGRLNIIKRSLAFRAHADVRDLSTLARLAKIPGTNRGTATADVAATGSFAAPSIDARVAFPSGEVRSVAFDSAGVTARYSARRLRLAGNMVFARKHGRVDMTGTMPIRLAPFEIGPNDQRIAFRARTTAVAIGVIDPLLDGVAQVGGALDSNVTVSGSVAEPVVAGSAQLRNGVLASRYDTIGARAVNADLSFANDTISLHDFRAALGSGTMTARGDAHVVPATALRKSPSLQFSLQAILNGAQVAVPNIVDGTVSGNVAVTRSGRVPYISGDLGFTNTSVPFATLLALGSRSSSATSQTKAMPGVPAPLPGRVTAYAGSLFASDFTIVTPSTPRPRLAARPLHIPRTYRLGLRLTAGKDVGISGAVSAQGTGTVDVTGTTRAPQLSGTLIAERGRAAFVNTRFDLTDGFVTFDPADGLLPTIEANATTSTDTADITVTIAGRVDQLHTDFTSTPEMSRDAIVASLLHIPQINSALASSHGMDQSQVGVSSQDVVTGALAGQVLGALNVGLNQLLNVGEVNFELDPRGAPGLEVRHPFGPHAYTIFRTTFSVPPAQSFGVAYVVRRALSVEFTQSQSTPGSSPVLAPPLTSIQVQLSFR